MSLHQEGEFPRVEPNCKEDAQRLWQAERHRMQDTLRRQKQQMAEDEKWLEKEERLLVGNRASLAFINPLSCLSHCLPTLEFNVPVAAARNRVSLSHVNPLALSRRPASLELNVPLVGVPKRGSMSIFYKVNLPVPLQDPVAPEGPADPAVGDILCVVCGLWWWVSQTKTKPRTICIKCRFDIILTSSMVM